MKSSGWIEICPLKVYKRTRAVTENRSSNWIFFLIAKHVTLAQACKTIQYMKRQGHKSLLAHSLANRIYVILTIAFDISRFKTGQLLIQNNQSIVKKKKNTFLNMKQIEYAKWKAYFIKHNEKQVKTGQQGILQSNIFHWCFILIILKQMNSRSLFKHIVMWTDDLVMWA